MYKYLLILLATGILHSDKVHAISCEANQTYIGEHVKVVKSEISERVEKNRKKIYDGRLAINSLRGGLASDPGLRDELRQKTFVAEDAQRAEDIREGKIPPLGNVPSCTAEVLYQGFVKLYKEQCPDLDSIRSNQCKDVSYNGNHDGLKEGGGTLSVLSTVRSEYEIFLARIAERNESCAETVRVLVLEDEGCHSSINKAFNNDRNRRYLKNYCTQAVVDEALVMAKREVLDVQNQKLCEIYESQLNHRRSQRAFSNELEKVKRSIACLQEGGKNCAE